MHFDHGGDVAIDALAAVIEKELWVYLLAHNVIHLPMAQAARNAGVHPRELSFKHTVQTRTEWTSKALRERLLQRAEFFRLIAQLTVGKTDQADSSHKLASDVRNRISG